MFSGLFGKKEKELHEALLIDKAFMTMNAKMKACADLARKEEDLVFLAWFSDTARQFQLYFSENSLEANRVTEVRQLHANQLISYRPVFLEHYPIYSKEADLVRNWTHKNILVFSSLDEPLFRYFGSEKIIPMMKMMGMKENEAISHPLVSQSIIKGQQKIEGKVSIDQSAFSQEEWMQKNLQGIN